MEIVSVEQEYRDELVYNFELEDNHTYFVTENAVLVHNYEKNIDFSTLANAMGAVDKNKKDFKAKEEARKKNLILLVNAKNGNKLTSAEIDEAYKEFEKMDPKKSDELYKSLEDQLDQVDKSYHNPVDEKGKTKLGAYFLNKDKADIGLITKTLNDISIDGKVKVQVDEKTGEMKFISEGSANSSLGNKILNDLAKISKTRSVQYVIQGGDADSYIDNDGKVQNRNNAFQTYDDGKVLRVYINPDALKNQKIDVVRDTVLPDFIDRILPNKTVTPTLTETFAHETIHLIREVNATGKEKDDEREEYYQTKIAWYGGETYNPDKTKKAEYGEARTAGTKLWTYDLSLGKVVPVSHDPKWDNYNTNAWRKEKGIDYQRFTY
ncbi:MAG: hypothetical protein KDK45_15040 [Leptospiraceae bacterium]|nr:hypothetical protein [Leptospiraceae bacterium]